MVRSVARSSRRATRSAADTGTAARAASGSEMSGAGAAALRTLRTALRTTKKMNRYSSTTMAILSTVRMTSITLGLPCLPASRLGPRAGHARRGAARREQPRPARTHEAGGRAGLRHDRLSKRSSVVPTSMRSPSCSVAWRTSRRLTRVPLVEPRSRSR